MMAAGCRRGTIFEGEGVLNYDLLGKNGLRASELFLGTMTFGKDWSTRLAGSWTSKPQDRVPLRAIHELIRLSERE